MTTGYAEQLMEPFNPQPRSSVPLLGHLSTKINKAFCSSDTDPFFTRLYKVSLQFEQTRAKRDNALTFTGNEKCRCNGRMAGNYRFYTAETRFTQNIKVSREIHFLVLFPRGPSVLYTSLSISIPSPSHHPDPYGRPSITLLSAFTAAMLRLFLHPLRLQWWLLPREGSKCKTALNFCRKNGVSLCSSYLSVFKNRTLNLFSGKKMTFNSMHVSIYVPCFPRMHIFSNTF